MTMECKEKEELNLCLEQKDQVLSQTTTCFGSLKVSHPSGYDFNCCRDILVHTCEYFRNIFEVPFFCLSRSLYHLSVSL